MSTWNIGMDDVSEEAQAFKDKISSKDSQIAALQTKLMRQAAEMEEIRCNLNDTLHKLTHETTRVLQLESDLQVRAEELSNEKIVSHNIGQALAATQEKIKEKDIETRELLTNLDMVSHTSGESNSRSAKLEQEKSVLEARIRELQANLQQYNCIPAASNQRVASRPRSSSLSNLRFTALEQEIRQVRGSLSQREADLLLANERVTQLHNELINAGNEKIAIEKKTSRQITDLQSSLEEMEDELQHLRRQQDDGSRERELIERIDEDGAKIAALEQLLGDTHSVQLMQERLRQTEEKLKLEQQRVMDNEERQVELVKEKEEALDELQSARRELDILTETLSNSNTHVRADKPTIGRGVNLMDMDTTDLCPVPLLSTTPNEVTVIHVERLLAAIERLRGERDTLRRNILFLESEHKFTVDALEAKLAASEVSTDTIEGTSTEAVKRLGIELGISDTRVVEVSRSEVRDVYDRDQVIKRLDRAVMASAIIIQHINSQRDGLEQRVLDVSDFHAEASLRHNQENSELKGKMKELGTKLEVMTLCLEATTSQCNDLMSQLEFKDSEHEEEITLLRSAHQQTCNELDRIEIQLSDVTMTLENVESERNSLALQVTNLLMDLRGVQDDLTNAETRYSTLQFHQLSSMSSNEATQALKDQITDLEMRVMRRTEQIGIHQHDIKRMETNMRLQEERLGEMTAELDTLNAQKDAMIEDCADAREARDKALARLETLEMDMEAQTEEGDKAIEALVEVIVRTVGSARDNVRRSSESARLMKEQLGQLEEEHKRKLRLLGEKDALLIANEVVEDSTIQWTLALAVSQLGASKALTHAQNTMKEKNLLALEIKSQWENLDRESAVNTSLKQQFETLRCEASVAAEDFVNRTSALEAEIQVLQHTISEKEATHQATVEELIRLKESLQANLDQTQQSITNDNTSEELSRLHIQHVEELNEVENRLISTQDTLEALRASHASTMAELEGVRTDALQLKQELEQQLNKAAESLRQGTSRQEETEKIQKEMSKEILQLQKDLGVAMHEARDANATRDELQLSYTRVLGELTQIKDDQESQLSNLNNQFLAVKQQLEGEVANLRIKLEGQLHELDCAAQETNRLTNQLRDETEGHLRDKKMYEDSLSSANQQRQYAETTLSECYQEMEALKREAGALKEEKSSLQEEITALEAEVQRSISLGRFLESQVKESESRIVSLTKELDQTRANLARAEQSAKTAELNIGLQSVQHKRETSDLHRQLTALRSQPNLQDTVMKLEERNSEMEELLKNKCAEIEENDDRALEMLKENKKLATKVESLGRKVQSLQTKLATVKASMPQDPSPKASSSTSLTPNSTGGPAAHYLRPNDQTTIPPVPPIPIYVPSSAPRTPIYRAASGPSSLPRPKTPEQRVAQPPLVFKARTPERRAVSTPPGSMISASTVGKKRRAPDDFEVCESLPPQGFTADSLPSHEPVESATRVRRVLSSLQSGFTPVRHQSTRPMIPIPSPKRMTTSTRPSPLIADVTNSPRRDSYMVPDPSIKPKGGWLGKIRGTSSTIGKSTDSARPKLKHESS